MLTVVAEKAKGAAMEKLKHSLKLPAPTVLVPNTALDPSVPRSRQVDAAAELASPAANMAATTLFITVVFIDSPFRLIASKPAAALSGASRGGFFGGGFSRLA
jgi:hypothetical protein